MYVRLASHVFPFLWRDEVARRGGAHPTTAAFRCLHLAAGRDCITMTGLGQTTRGEIFLPVEAVTAGETCGDRNRPLIPKSMSIPPAKAASSRMSSAATQACRPPADGGRCG